VAKVLLGVTGSVAAIRTPALHDALRKAGHDVRIVATQAALYFFDPAAIGPADTARPARNRSLVILDEDEWPGRAAGQRYQREDEVLHIELRRWAELLLIAPLDANTLAKLACGLADNCLTCVWRAWDVSRPVILAPAMNTLMWDHRLTGRHLRQLGCDFGATEPPAGLDPDHLVAWINQNCPGLRVAGPVSKRLACGDVGVGGMAAVEEIAAAVERILASGDPFGD
jgi:phosphopantothenoylcysteine decarboxylase